MPHRPGWARNRSRPTAPPACWLPACSFATLSPAGRLPPLPGTRCPKIHSGACPARDFRSLPGTPTTATARRLSLCSCLVPEAVSLSLHAAEPSELGQAPGAPAYAPVSRSLTSLQPSRCRILTGRALGGLTEIGPGIPGGTQSGGWAGVSSCPGARSGLVGGRPIGSQSQRLPLSARHISSWCECCRKLHPCSPSVIGS
jgi:hypothetical protein